MEPSENLVVRAIGLGKRVIVCIVLVNEERSIMIGSYPFSQRLLENIVTCL